MLLSSEWFNEISESDIDNRCSDLVLDTTLHMRLYYTLSVCIIWNADKAYSCWRNAPYNSNLKCFNLDSSEVWKLENLFQILQIIYIRFQAAT
jgi:hypothetical protein